MRLPTEHGVSIALLVNELVMNALKHGRPADKSPIIHVRLPQQQLTFGPARPTQS